jgi:endonuclease/exonuclease/phosphatase family metal-dependent hydrolase
MLKVLTLNLNHYVDKHGLWQKRRALITDTIRSASPDIMAFQAVRRDSAQFDGQNQAAQLAGMLDGYPHVLFQPAMEHTDGSESGQAIVSRLPVAETEDHKLSLIPVLEDDTQRVVLKARFDLPGGPFYLFNAHFSWVEEQLRDNVADALSFMQSASGPALLVGDLNAPAGKGFLDPFRQAGWVDAWEKLNGSEQGYTFEAGNLSIRIDYAWANPQLASRLNEIRVVGDRSGSSGERMSDHLGLLVSLNL